MTSPSHVEAILRQELARGDVALAGVAPVLTHLLAGTGQSLVSDSIVAHMRGMLGNIAEQMLQAQLEGSDNAHRSVRAEPAQVDALSQRLVGSTIVLSHVYALSVEAHFANTLEETASIDPVLSPLLQELIASEQEETAEIAMAAMAAQARFMQAQRRMNLPLAELPSELFHQVLSIWRRFSSDVAPDVLSRAEAAMRDRHKEASSRLGLLGRLVSSMKGAVHAALSIDHAGISLFASAISSATRQPRELAVLACHEGQIARLALTLRGAGVKPQEVARQIALIHPEMTLPEGFEELSERQALSMLGSARGASQSARQA
ncbi:hypothetical protein [Altererythrobacter sp. GH1-8]|uniref:hypothetical protein n=1 Tax=Altererythrobacter sp. GH1-8 TaxID=3349333 RepID=UPI00374D4C52